MKGVYPTTTITIEQSTHSSSAFRDRIAPECACADASAAAVSPHCVLKANTTSIHTENTKYTIFIELEGGERAIGALRCVCESHIVAKQTWNLLFINLHVL